jgi:hypothetical protein
MDRGRGRKPLGRVKVIAGAAVVVVAFAGLYWLGPGKAALSALGFAVDQPQFPPEFATAAVIDWTDLIPPPEQGDQERLADGSLPRGLVLHGQLGPSGPAPAGDPSNQLSALAQQLGGFNNLDAPPRRVADAYAFSGIGNLKGLQPPGVDIRADLDGKVVKIAGFVTPLGFNGTRISEFLLVPFVGACIHVPPPPANQIVYVSDLGGYAPNGGLLYPVWVTGKLKAMPLDTDLANVGYQIEGAKVEPYPANPTSTIPISGN